MVDIDWGKVSTYFLISAIVVTSAVLMYKMSTPAEVKVSMNGYTVGNTNILEGNIKDFLILSQRFATQHTYSDEYNCVNYTEDLYNIAVQLGFNVERVVGCPPEGSNKTCHEWLRLAVDFEPQQGRFADYSLEFPNQDIVETK